MFRWLWAGMLCCGIALGAQETRVSTGTTRPVSRVNLGFQAGLVTSGGAYGGSFLTGVNLLVDRNSSVWLGLDTGVIFGHSVHLPILLSVLFQSPDRARGVRPYLGGAIGPVIRLSNGGGLAGAGDAVKLAILVRPGIRFQVAESLDMNAEMALGGLTGIFYISPAVGISIHL